MAAAAGPLRAGATAAAAGGGASNSRFIRKKSRPSCWTVSADKRASSLMALICTGPRCGRGGSYVRGAMARTSGIQHPLTDAYPLDSTTPSYLHRW